MMNVSEPVPSTSGSALKFGADTIVKSAAKEAKSSAVGRMNNWWQNKLCHAYSLITLMN